MKSLKSLFLLSLFGVGCGQAHVESENSALSEVNPQFVASSVAPYLGKYVGETSGLFSSDVCDVVLADNGVVVVKSYDEEYGVKEELKYWGLSEPRITRLDEDKLVFENSDGSGLLGYEKMKLTLKLDDGVLDSVKVSFIAVGLANSWNSLTCENLKRK